MERELGLAQITVETLHKLQLCGAVCLLDIEHTKSASLADFEGCLLDCSSLEVIVLPPFLCVVGRFGRICDSFTVVA